MSSFDISKAYLRKIRNTLGDEYHKKETLTPLSRQDILQELNAIYVEYSEKELDYKTVIDLQYEVTAYLKKVSDNNRAPSKDVLDILIMFNDLIKQNY